MKTIGEFTIGEIPINDLGQAIAEGILEDVEQGEKQITDEIFKEFLCCIFAKGNFEYLRVIAKNYYSDTRKDVILEFIDIVEEMTEWGQNSLQEKSQTFISK